MKAGIVLMWWGIAANVPYGWKICNGSFDTYNSINRFVVGAGGAYALGAIGGLLSHSHHFTSNNHRHLCIALPGITTNATPYRMTAQYTEYEPAVGDTDSLPSLPPYHALYYIQRM